MHLSYPLAAHVGTHNIIYLIPYPLSSYFTSNRSLALPSRSLFLFSLSLLSYCKTNNQIKFVIERHQLFLFQHLINFRISLLLQVYS